jgi:4Fe-4S iron-sulfur cluster binding domain/DR2241 stabilising domain
MMLKIENLALNAFVASIGDECVLAQVLIRRGPSPFTLTLSPPRGEGTERCAGYELRHVDDAATTADNLRLVTINDARLLAQSTASGEFRPLKSAPNLQRGWRLVAVNDAELEAALSRLYPGAVADWFAARSVNPPVTNYREYANRQSGMFRVTAKLSDAQVASVIKAACDAKFCLKRRLWRGAGLAADTAADKSLIPCLEPCAILLESARRTFRAEQPENPTGSHQMTKQKKSILTLSEWFECGGAAFALWMWYDILGSHDLIKLCIMGAGLTLLQTGFCHFIYTVLRSFHLLSRLPFTCATFVWICLTIFTWDFVYKNSEPLIEAPTFALSVSIVMGTSDREMLPEFWFVTDQVAYAVPLAILFDFTNLKQISSRIRGYSVETQINGNKWITMQSVDTRQGNIVSIPPPGTNFADARIFLFQDIFNEKISDINISPGVPVEGWLFLSIPKEGWNPKHIRFRIVYSSESDDVQPVIMFGPKTDTDFRQGKIIMGTNEDISAIPKKFWEERYTH